MLSGAKIPAFAKLCMAQSPPLIPLNWSQAIWDVSGAFAYDRELLAFHDFCERHLALPRPMAWVHGAPPSSWNSGRLPNKLHPLPSYLEAIGAYNKRGIGLLFTASNTLLQKEHLDESMGNLICQKLHSKGSQHGLIMSSDVLNEYVKSTFPKLKRISSILKITAAGGKGKADLYKRYLDEYDYVMLHPDDVLDCAFIETLPEPHRLIALINEYCVRHCPIRHVHYKSLSRGALNYLGANEEAFDKLKAGNGCNSLYQLLTDETQGTLALHESEIQALYERGVRHFKVQGRGMGHAAPLINDLMRLMWGEDAPQENRKQALRQFFWESLKPLPMSL